MPRHQDERLRLTPAAEAALNEYADAHRARLLNEAAARSATPMITPDDVVSANAALQARTESSYESRLEARQLVRSLTSNRFTTWLTVGGAYLFTLLAVFTTLSYTDAIESPVLAFLQIVLAVLGSVVLLLVVTLQMRDSRRRAVTKFETDEFIAALYPEPSRTETPKKLAAHTDRDADVEGMEVVVRWANVEGLLKQLASRALGLEWERASRMPVGELMRSLHRSGVIEDSTYNALRLTLDGRNRAAHGQDIPMSERETLLSSLRELTGLIQRLLDAHPDLTLFHLDEGIRAEIRDSGPDDDGWFRLKRNHSEPS